VSSDGSFLFHNLVLPPDHGYQISFRGSLPPKISNARTGRPYRPAELANRLVVVSHNAWDTRDLSARELTLGGRIEGMVINARTRQPVAEAVIRMTVGYRTGGVSTGRHHESAYSATADKSGRYSITKEALFAHLFGSVPADFGYGTPSVDSIRDLRTSAAGFRTTPYSPPEAASFDFYPHVYTRNFVLSPVR
jgi:hypothetical protein